MNRLIAVFLLLLLGGSRGWSADTARFVQATSRDGKVNLAFSDAVTYRAERFSNPPRLVLNLYGAQQDRKSPDLTRLRAPWLASVKAQPLFSDSLRLTFQLSQDIDLETQGALRTTSLTLAPRGSTNRGDDTVMSVPVPAANGTLPPRRDKSDASRPTTGGDNAPGDPGKTTVERIGIETGDELCRLQFDLSSDVKPQAFVINPDPPRSSYYRLVMDFPNAAVVPPEQSRAVPDNALIAKLRIGVFDFTAARVVLDLKRKVNYSITTDPASHQVTLTLTPFTGAGGPAEVGGSTGIGGGDPSFSGAAPSTEAGALQGRTIVIDAGHGGYDNGTNGYGLLEKNVALDISRRLATTLKDAGVNAILTRDDDRFIRLPDRPAVANRIGADAFVAIHLNSTGSVRNIWSGTETYYHFQDPVCRELAKQIQSQLILAIGLPDRGARSDTFIAPRLGFSVLRNSQVPAVLVEVGYLNHPGDAAKLKTPEFRQRAAEGIMAGLRSYFARASQSARRSANP